MQPELDSRSPPQACSLWDRSILLLFRQIARAPAENRSPWLSFSLWKETAGKSELMGRPACSGRHFSQVVKLLPSTAVSHQCTVGTTLCTSIQAATIWVLLIYIWYDKKSRRAWSSPPSSARVFPTVPPPVLRPATIKPYGRWHGTVLAGQSGVPAGADCGQWFWMLLATTIVLPFAFPAHHHTSPSLALGYFVL